jgi:hypothetical protein
MDRRVKNTVRRLEIRLSPACRERRSDFGDARHAYFRPVFEGLYLYDG